MGLFDAIFGFGGTLASSAMSWAASREAMDTQYKNQRKLNEQSAELSLANSKDYTSWYNQNAYGQMRTGLENAGYNPMLAVGASPGGSTMSVGSGSAGLSTPQISNLGDGVTNAYRAFKLERDKTEAEVDNLNASQKATNASVSLIKEQAKSEQYRQKEMEANTALANINKMLGDKSLSWYDRRQLMEIKTGYINAQANHLASEASQLNAHTAQADYRMRKGVTDYENVSRKALADFYKAHPKQKGIVTGIGEWTGAIGNVFRGSLSRSFK